MLQKEGCETHCLVAKFSSNCGFCARAMVTPIEQQVESALDGWNSSRELSGSLGVEQHLQSRQSFLGSRNAFLNRCITRDEGTCDLRILSRLPQVAALSRFGVDVRSGSQRTILVLPASEQ